MTDPATSTFEPQDRDLVYTINPEQPNEKPTLAFVVRRASTEDKELFVARMKTRLGSGEELEEKTLHEWMKNESIFLCIEDEEITMIDGKFIKGPALPEDLG